MFEREGELEREMPERGKERRGERKRVMTEREGEGVRERGRGIDFESHQT